MEKADPDNRKSLMESTLGLGKPSRLIRRACPDGRDIGLVELSREEVVDRPPTRYSGQGFTGYRDQIVTLCLHHKRPAVKMPGPPNSTGSGRPYRCLERHPLSQDVHILLNRRTTNSSLLPETTVSFPRLKWDRWLRESAKFCWPESRPFSRVL